MKLEEIEATYLCQRHRFDSCIIGEAEIPANGKSASIITIKGDADTGELARGQRYRFYGRFSSYQNKRTGHTEKQFHFQTFVAAFAHDREGVVAYLISIGAGHGIGKVTAERAFDLLGENAVAIIRQSPRELLKLNSRITIEECEIVGEKLTLQKCLEDATIQLTSLLAGRGLPKTTARNAIKKWGNRAAEIVRRDPYSLMNFRGCGFKLCDSLYLELGHNPARLRRQALCAWYSIASQSTGDIWYPASQVIRAIEASIGAAKARPRMAIRMAMRLGRLSPDHYGAMAGIKTDGKNGPINDNGKTVWLAEGRAAMSEQSLAKMIAVSIDEAKPKPMIEFTERSLTWREAIANVQCRRCGRMLTAPEVHVWDGKPFEPTCITHISDGTDVEVVSLDDWKASQPLLVQSAIAMIPSGKIELPAFSLWPDPYEIAGIDDHQRGKLAEALISRVAILGGRPGTGKTYSVAMLIRSLLASGRVSADDIAIGAPTGKAAVRLSESLQAAGVPLLARTWHSLLGVVDGDRGGWSFQHDESNVWSYRIIIGDEWSMVDNSLARAIFAARPRGAHMLLVGDVNQLPPVGAGAPLRDIIASGTCGYGELTEIKRNTGGIVEACAAIIDGKRWEEGDNLHLVDAVNETAVAAILKTLDKCRAEKLDPVWDCQVIVAVNDKSELSRAKINKVLQHELNANPEIEGTPFRLADKIVCLKNGKYPMAKKGGDGETYVANGELAEVIAVEEKRLLARLQITGDEIVIPRGKSKKADGDDDAATGCSWDLAYGLTCHKMQGSEARVVIVCLDSYPGARLVCDRSWLNTAISRAKSRCYLIGKRHIADSMCRNCNIDKRKTLLRQRIQLEVSRILMMEII